MITRINKLKTLTEHTSCECKCKFDWKKCNSDQRWNNDKHHVCEKDYVWNPATCSCEKYLASIMDDSAIMCDDIIESYDNETDFNKK